MLAEFIVSFREFFEILLLVGIMLAYLEKTRRGKYKSYVYAGVALAAIASVGTAYVFSVLSGWFEANEELFEGVAMVTATLFVTWALFWMLRHSNVEKEMQSELGSKSGSAEAIGLVLFSFITVFREGAEIVFFLGGIALSTGALNAAGALAGVVAAILLTYFVFTSLVRLNHRKFFLATSAMLMLLAAGLLSQGVHELQEAKILPTFIEHVYDITPALGADGSFPPMHEKGVVGALLKGLIGYDTAPSLLQVLAYVGYLGIVFRAYAQAATSKKNA